MAVLSLVGYRSKYSSLPDESLHKHLISFAFWTCQQLER